MSNSRPSSESANLKIGAVARLTGISVHTLRKWEDRYAAVQPRRTEGGERVYTRPDLKRLALIKRLSDAGLSLREIATLTLEELETAWVEAVQTQGTALSLSGASVPDTIRVVILGDVLPALLERRTSASSRIQVVASGDSEKSIADALGEESADILVYECPTVQPESRARVGALLKTLSVGAAIVVYGFGTGANVASLRQGNVAIMKAPVDLEELEHIARGLLLDAAAPRVPPEVAASPVVDAPPPLLTREAVARIAMSAPKIRCECPHHLADIVLSLLAFEEYSESCEDANPEDADLHRFLGATAGQARALFEQAIVRVAEVEGIDLE